MKKNLILFFTLYSLFAAAQSGQWVWLHGSNTTNSPGSFGFQGVPSVTNEPPAVYEMCQWTDLNGNFWFFGGEDKSGNSYSDLWMYNPATNQWTWMKGNATLSYGGYYGTQGVPGAFNNPPARSYASTGWVDAQNNLWLFSGYGYSDLWKYNISTNQWTWMKGPNGGGGWPGVYGTQGVADTANYPHDRCETSVGWTDNSGNFLVYGGVGFTGGLLNDLWKYNISSNSWTWVQGSKFSGFPPTYGTKGIEDSANTPGSRYVYAHWKDTKGRLYLFSGSLKSGNKYYNDLWRYNPVTNNWAWINGADTMNSPGSYGTKCNLSPTNTPAARYEDRANWTDKEGNFWLYGGGLIGFGTLWNDLWKYCVTNNEWTWVSGDTTINNAGNYGIKGVANPANKPSARAGAIGWYRADTSGNQHLYLFGGWASTGLAMYNDLWKFDVDSTCGVCAQGLPLPQFTTSDTIFCDEPGKCIDFFDHSTNNPTSWKWIFPGASPDTSTQQNPIQICYRTPGTYPVTLIVTNSGGTDSVTVYPMIILGNPPTPPIVTAQGDTIFSTHGSTYRWFFNGVPIPGATDSFYVATQTGTYSVQIADDLGCTALSNGVYVLITSAQALLNNGDISAYPNPVSKILIISHLSADKNETINIYNVLGERVYTSYTYQVKNIKDETVIDVSFLEKGVYIIQVENDKEKWISKFIKQ